MVTFYCYAHTMNIGNWFGFSIRGVARAIGGTASEASLRRWGTHINFVLSPPLIPVSERDAIVYARVFAAMSRPPLHSGAVKVLAESLYALPPLPEGKGWVLVESPSRVRVFASLTGFTDAAQLLREPFSVVPFQ
jgi:hypothetical protein